MTDSATILDELKTKAKQVQEAQARMDHCDLMSAAAVRELNEAQNQYANTMRKLRAQITIEVTDEVPSA